MIHEIVAGLSEIIRNLTPFILAYIAWRVKKADENAKLSATVAAQATNEVKKTLVATGQLAAAATKEVKDTLAESGIENAAALGRITKIAAETHTLVNSQRGALLKSMALLARSHALMAKKYETTYPGPEGVKIAEAAEMAALAAEANYDLHQEQQAIVDAGHAGHGG